MVEQPENIIAPKTTRTSSFERNLVGVAKGGGITLASKMFTNVIRLVTAFLLARLLGAEQYGMYQLSLNVITLVAGVVLPLCAAIATSIEIAKNPDVTPFDAFGRGVASGFLGRSPRRRLDARQEQRRQLGPTWLSDD